MKPRIRNAALIALPLALLSLTGCKGYGAKSTSGEVLPAVKVTGEPVNCIPLQSYNETRVRNDRTIDFIRIGKKGWRNTLPHSCPGLKAQNAFTFSTSLTQLCSTDIVYVLYNYSGRPERGPGCGLGQFVPVEFVK